MRHLALLAVLLPNAAGCVQVHVHMVRVGADAEQVATAVHDAWTAHIAAAQRRDLDGVCAIYADDIAYCIAGQPELHGKPAVEAMERSGMQSSTVNSATHLSLALHVDGGVTHELGTIAGEVAGAGQPPARVEFHFVGVWQRGADRTWRLARLVGHMADAARAPGAPDR